MNLGGLALAWAWWLLSSGRGEFLEESPSGKDEEFPFPSWRAGQDDDM